jgi:hypothetical protein
VVAGGRQRLSPRFTNAAGRGLRGMDAYTEDGVLVLADISGFTAFVATTELEHGPPIIAALLEVVMRKLSPPLEIQEVEGDAVFALAADRALRAPAALTRKPAYLLLTEAALRWVGLDPAGEGLAAHEERYEHLGDVRCFVRDFEEPGRLVSCAA